MVASMDQMRISTDQCEPGEINTNEGKARNTMKKVEKSERDTVLQQGYFWVLALGLDTCTVGKTLSSRQRRVMHHRA
jgi:uncharacterized protein YmfQ (DUF2313 family)